MAQTDPVIDITIELFPTKTEIVYLYATAIFAF
jgi:hypothetical protein